MAGHIISVIGAKGGVGKSQVATNLAFAFAAEERSRVLLMDFDQKACGDQNLLTGLQSPKSLKEISQFAGSIDPKTFQGFVSDRKSVV